MTQSATTTAPVHTYATRIRQNITIKPSTRLRHSPEPHRKLRPAPPPPTDTALQDDCPPSLETRFPGSSRRPPSRRCNKPCLSFNRAGAPFRCTSFPSLNVPFPIVSPQDNRAVTIKDLAEIVCGAGSGLSKVCHNMTLISLSIYFKKNFTQCIRRLPGHHDLHTVSSASLRCSTGPAPSSPARSIRNSFR
ncbi:hypothetical protein EDD18DRAFT_615669 [Armillaria luteobubalina]|uniref:Uncharacterized protein n=1 Tax=Armillaria luteobubalina TaxID=153913 RepID=A0AA39QIJ7_9AGAR|nr:hypothetical protein EDD18DRAFT_615669 [Armillaria luteobubalina]